MNEYEARVEARRQRLEDRAERLRREGEARIGRARQMADCIPFGQPILVGHHSEGRDRSFRKRIRGNFDKGYEALKEAGEVAARAASVGSGGVSSDDPEAVDKLILKLAELEARHAAIKGRKHESWELSNSSANMRRVKERIEHLRRSAQREHKEREVNGVRIVENVEANRLQLFFLGKPEAEIRAKLKSHGFRWSPMEGAWQRHLGNNAIWAANYVLGVA
jgi:hypothetical protein